MTPGPQPVSQENESAKSLRARGFAGSAAYLARMAPSLPWRVRRLLREASYDRTMGVRTSPSVSAGALGIEPGKLPGVAVNASGNAYMPTPAWAVFAILRELDIAFPDYTFIDLGSAWAGPFS